MPDGLCGEPAPANPTWTLRAFLSESAHLESASVPAFVVLARDLRDLGAPEEFIVASLAAVHDEVAHARVTNQLALEHGGSAWNEVTVEVKSHRTLFDVALENAVEGCVRETFGALVAGCQAMKAQDAAIARTMLQIAQDETRHAALAFAVHEWLLPQLSASERDKIQSAQEAAISSLRTTLTMQHEAEVYDAAGWPQPHEALALHDRLVAQLWS